MMNNTTKMFARTALAALAIGLASSASAAAVTYTLTGFGSATIGNVTKEGAFTATGIGDTANVAFPASGISIVPLTSFTIAFGASTYTAVNPIRYFTNNNIAVAGFGDTTTQDVLNFATAAFSTYNSVSNFGPSPVTFSYRSVLATNAGALNFTADPTNLVFRAVVVTSAVPETGTWAMMLAGFGVVGGMVRRRQRVSVTFA